MGAELRRIGIVALDQVHLGGLGAILDLFDIANRYMRRQYDPVDGVPRPTEIELLTAHGEACRTSSGRKLGADAAWTDRANFDVVYVANFQVEDEADLEARLATDAALGVWLNERRAEGALIAASGAGVFHLAQAGLLADQVATVPWWLERAFGRLYPHLTLDIARVIAEGEGVLCAGSAKGEQALALRLAERVLSPNVANWLAKVTLIDAYPDGPAPWSVFSPRVIRQDGMVGRAQHWLQQRFSQKPRMSELASFMRVSERTLERRFHKSLGMTPLAYLQTLRIEAAKQMLARSSRRIERVAYLVGYADTAFFKQVFRDHVGMSPGEYRRDAAGLAATRR